MIFLIGYRGTGKTTVARLLAASLGWPWLDADEVLEHRYGTTIREIFATEGEACFRAKEEAILAELCTRQRQVIATGGGVILRENNREKLRTIGWVIWLTADVETIRRRLASDSTTCERRPALTTATAAAEVADLLKQREPLYASCADLTVSTVGRSPEAVAAVIQAAWSSRPAAVAVPS